MMSADHCLLDDVRAAGRMRMQLTSSEMRE
jgi:hypothetical protein